MNWLRVVLLAVIPLSACTVIPGPHLRSGDGLLQGPSQNFNTDIVYHEITTDLVLSAMQTDARPENDLGDLLSTEGSEYEYRVGPGDLLAIRVWENPADFAVASDFQQGTPAYEVYVDGSIYFPYLGLLPVAGLTVPEIRQLVIDNIASIITRPSVDVTVRKYNSQKVYVAGALGGAGELPLDAKEMTLLRAIQSAGGLGENADLSSLSLTRGDKTYSINLTGLYRAGDPVSKITLQDGDILYVPSVTERRVVLLGDAGQGIYPIGQTGMSLAELLGTGGGVNRRTADPRGVFVLRGVGMVDYGAGKRYRADVYRLNVASAANFLLATQFPLQPKDVVFVTTAPIARWNAFISALLPTIFSVDRIDELTNN